MCIIYVCTEKVPSLKELEHAEDSNQDGGGMAFPVKTKEGPKIEYYKGMTAKDMMKKIREIRSTPLILHFRIATDGPEVDELTHPFPVTTEMSQDLHGFADMVMAHNGRWASWKNEILEYSIKLKAPIPSGPWSDTRAMAWLTAHMGIGHLQLKLADYQGEGCTAGKLVWMSTSQLVIHPYEAWTEKSGWVQSRDLGDFSKAEKKEETKGRMTHLLPPSPPTVTVVGGKDGRGAASTDATQSGTDDSEDEGVDYTELKEQISSLTETQKIRLYTKTDMEEIISDMKLRNIQVVP